MSEPELTPEQEAQQFDHQCKNIRDELKEVPVGKDGWRIRNKFLYLHYKGAASVEEVKKVVFKLNPDCNVYSLIAAKAHIFFISSEVLIQ